MDNKNKMDTPMVKLSMFDDAISKDDHSEIKLKDCCGSCQGNGACLKDDLLSAKTVNEINKV